MASENLPSVSVSISYLLNAGLLLMLAQFWRGYRESKKDMHDKINATNKAVADMKVQEVGTMQTKVAVLEAKYEVQSGLLSEMRGDIKRVLGILGAKGSQ